MSDHANLGLPPWILDYLRCPTCGDPIDTSDRPDEYVRCTGCDQTFAVDRGVVDFLDSPHPAVADERQAVAALDAGEVSLPPSGDATDAAQAFHRHVEQSRGELLRVLERRPLAAGELVIELGADGCWASSLFLDAGCRVIAVDITNHLHLAENAGNPDLCRLQTDMNALPLAAGMADVVWATAAAHHSWDLALTFREAARVLRPGGRLYFCCEPMPSWLRWPFGLAVGDAERELGIHETWVPRRRWLRLARAAGFDSELVFPSLDDEQVAARLRARSLPAPLIPLLATAVRPILRTLQVSMHLFGDLGSTPKSFEPSGHRE